MTRHLVVVLCMLMLCGFDASAAKVVFRQAVPGRILTFPRDHGKHPDFQTEWWYFTGNLESKRGREWGFQLTFFRRGLAKKPARKSSAWGVTDLYPAHFALTDVRNRAFFHKELISRGGPGLAEAAPNRLKVRVKDWSAEQRGKTILIKAHEGEYALDLKLVPMKPVVLHGLSGFSRKGDEKGQASYYYSLTRLKALGTLRFKGTIHRVTGLAWMDHEFGSSILTRNQAGWDWFSLQLDDGTDLMVFHLRRKDGTFEQTFGTLVAGDGRTSDLSGQRIRISPIGTWTSPHTKAVYPSGWRVEIPGRNIALKITPLVQDQELSSGASTGIIYWEGAVRAQGSRDGKEIKGKGYVELTGYARAIGAGL
ncbi:MAG: lipocalin-like domain-containing protein [Deltaproteobacteria bacterium]